MADFVRAAATAKRLIAENGRLVTFYRSNRTPDDAGKPWRGTSSAPASGAGGATIGPLRMAFVPAGTGAAGLAFGKLIADQAGTVAVKLEQVGLVAADAVVDAGFTAEDLEECDSIQDGAQVWKIETRGHLRPADKALLFVVGLIR